MEVTEAIFGFSFQTNKKTFTRVEIVYYLRVDCPRFPWGFDWKIQYIERVSCGSNRNSTISITTAFFICHDHSLRNLLQNILMLKKISNKVKKNLPVHQNLYTMSQNLLNYWQDCRRTVHPIRYYTAASASLITKLNRNV